jgi:hypothetical protein
MSREDFHKEMDNVKKDQKIAKVTKSKDGDWAKLAVNRKDDDGVIVARLKLAHK